MAQSSHSFFLISLLLLILHSDAAGATTKLVDKVCQQTSSYSFCVNSLYSDSRTPDADEYTLAFISVGLAYANATSTRDHISELLKNHHDHYQQPLQRCVRNYNKAISLLAMADNDLNSETFFELADLANQASRAATDCDAAFKGIPSPPLANRNSDLKALCQICGILGKLFTGLL
ncbi:cell wall / vacuolar inhibitor of fructosidase 2 [Ricinus communis]|uniref:Pectinesterase inhibitor, putative n=1 Tax=Ricinus communis TaxID=3988 RepID=B9SGW4_RICCO|nr:cell wall / vacuolar inhibitor of fructosidase 2 [Ricinus communis]XP_015578465.1 cell wall / vacuolar inhibitor of fructosidase 2 [Ricinus communis]XP_015578466.1 cell wall / vacuolar inhibitor of fructosidase 2 [Ricinus communis]XP_025014206.1 cell wall / vacuolar inhibitor of fructosidase 2 [Ricinus communis]EEF37199.1 Pectinesterase inhibitor, putative [Ricinus communis]|eukprot:XP_002525233.1 cell wall / vacuolar inhibitor of fructosidase 2 [Ricinus communis]